MQVSAAVSPCEQEFTEFVAQPAILKAPCADTLAVSPSLGTGRV